MKDRFLCLGSSLAAVVATVAFVPVAPAQGQVTQQTAMATGKAVTQTWKTPRTPDGHPDLQGFWSNNNATPIERPKELAGRATLTDAELTAMKKKAHELFS